MELEVRPPLSPAEHEALSAAIARAGVEPAHGHPAYCDRWRLDAVASAVDVEPGADASHAPAYEAF